VDAWGNTLTPYTFPAYLVSSDGQQVTPLAITLTNGVGTAKVTLSKPGTIQLKAVYGAAWSWSDSITVSA
jgi:hypothetical protein